MYYKEAVIICLIQDFDFPKKVSLKILNSGLTLKTFTHACCVYSKDMSQLDDSFECQNLFQLMGKNIIKILLSKILLKMDLCI